MPNTCDVPKLEKHTKIVSGRGTYGNVSHGLHYWFDTVRHRSGLVTARFVLPTERFQIYVNSKVKLP